MRYLNLLLSCAAEPWALQREKLRDISQFLLFKSAGGELSPQEVQARTAGAQDRPPARQDAPAARGGKIAVIQVFGMTAPRMNLMLDVSGGTSTHMLAADLRAALSETAVKAIVLDIDSPGGTVSGTQEIATEISRSRGVKPIIAQVNYLAASAAYWIASAADQIVVAPSGKAGSIGVYSIHEDISKALAAAGVKETIIRAGRHKLADNPFEPLSDETRAFIQSQVNMAYAAFVRGVSTGRRVSPATVVDRFGEGRLFGAEELVSRGMADRVDTIEGTLERLGSGPFNSVAARGAAAREFADLRGSLQDLSRHLALASPAAAARDMAAMRTSFDELRKHLSGMANVRQL